MAKAIILGSGTSTGVPVIGCSCAACTSTDPRDQRLRASLLLKVGSEQNIVIDTGPDFRTQMLRAGVKTLSQVLFTHSHADHCHGFDDLRAFFFTRRTPVPCYVSTEHIEEFKARFAYVFADTGYLGTKPQVDLIPFQGGTFQIGGIEVETAMLPHGNARTAVFRIGRFAYATDFKAFTPELIARWRGKIDTMVASGIHFRSHATHSSIPETLSVFAQLGVRRGVVTHLTHEILHARDEQKLPPGAILAHDGLELEVDVAP